MPTTIAPAGQLVNLVPATQTATTNGTSIVPAARVKNHSVYIIGTGTISSGTLVIEESEDPAFSGTWSSIQSVTLSGVTGGAIQVVHFTSSSMAIRSRVSVAVGGGGSIQVDYRGETD